MQFTICEKLLQVVTSSKKKMPRKTVCLKVEAYRLINDIIIVQTSITGDFIISKSRSENNFQQGGALSTTPIPQMNNNQRDNRLGLQYLMNHLIDLRSDVVTRAPQAMLKIMSETPCVNNASLDDFQTLRFEERIAKMFNKDGAVFFLTASMANLASVLLYTRPGSQVIISSTCHSIERESSSFARIAGVQTRQIFTESGTFTPQQVKQRIRKSTSHVTFPDTDLIFLENGTFRGQVWNLDDLRAIKKIAEEGKVKVHIDGARIFNALATYKIQAKDISDCFDSMTLCFTKGLCCPIGAAVVCSKENVLKLKNIRKSLGGGVLHSGILSNSFEYALDNLLPEIARDNQMAHLLAVKLSEIEGVDIKVENVQINMVYWRINLPNFDHKAFFEHLKGHNIRIKPFDEDSNTYRFVTYYHIREKEVETTAEVIKNYLQNIPK